MSIENIFSLEDFFEQVQLQSVFSDGKTFVDCTPRSDLAHIHACYLAEKDETKFSLSDFVHQHFIVPETYSTDYISDPGEPIIKHIEGLWDVLTRKPHPGRDSLIELPFPYIVPGGRFREIYYWDSYFTMLGLQVSNRTDIIENMIDNFCYLIDRFGYIPNGNRTYFLSRSQPPFFACMIQLLSEVKGKKILVKYLPHLEKEYHFWMKGKENITPENSSSQHVCRLMDGSLLNRYWDEAEIPRPEAFKNEIQLARNKTDKKTMYRHLRAAAESGWDFSSRWFKNKKDFSTIHTTDIVPIDLNCLLLNLEETIAAAYELSNDRSSSARFQSFAEARKKAINTYCWNEEKNFYFDYDRVEKHQTDSLTVAAAFPLFFGVASQQQADGVARMLKEKFLFPGGLITTTETTGQQWDSPNGWAPLHWVTIKGLAHYGHIALAKDIASRWMTTNKRVYESTGKMMEKYNVIETTLEAGGGEYPAQDGFGWTNGVYLAMDKWLKNLED